MEIEKKENKDKVTLKFKGSVTIYEASTLKQELLNCLEKNESLVLNLHEIDRCDTAGIQVIYSAFKTAEQIKKRFSVEKISSAVVEAALNIGLDLEKVFGSSKAV